MNYKFPHTIENCIGERITFKTLERSPDGDAVIVESLCQPGSGPIMHTHFKQEEIITVVSGTMGYQVKGQKPAFVRPGESVEFKRGVPHRFWAEGNEVLRLAGKIKPANTIVFYLSSIYAAQNKSGTARPEQFDGAYLLTRYASEYEIADMPVFVKKVVVPITYLVGKALGKYKHFKDAPKPLTD